MGENVWSDFVKAHVWLDSNDGKQWFGSRRYRREGQAVKACYKKFKEIGKTK